MQNKLLKNQPSNANAIGVMDSGVGGLSVLKHIHRRMPQENLIYFADSQYAPYGDKTPKQIEDRVFAIAKFLLTHGAKALVIACNTATAISAQKLRDKYAFLDLPIIAMEPAVKPASAATKTGVVGVLATVGTLQSAQFAALLDSYGKDIQVVTQGCVGLVECVERGELTAESTKALLTQYTQPLLDQGADTIVLGCTHYPFVKPLIQAIVGDEIQIIDTGEAVAKHLQNTLQAQSLENISTDQPQITVWTNNQAEDAEAVLTQLWGEGDLVVKQWR
jgi:glutamate racemase